MTQQIDMSMPDLVLSPNAVVEDSIKENVESFLRDGFIGPIKLYEPEEAAEMLREIRIGNQNTSKILYENKMNYDRHFDIKEMSKHITHPTIVKILSGILGPDILLWRTEFFSKFPGAEATEWHQVRDYSYTNGNPLIVPTEDWNSFLDITVWTAFTDATKETACMKFLKGSHNKKFYDESKSVTTGRDSKYHYSETDTGFFGYNFDDFKTDPNWEPEEKDIVELELKAGEAVIFSAACVHGSLPNISERESRIAITSRFVPTHVRIYPNMNKYEAHGEIFDLSNYASVLVNGENVYDHNKVRSENNLGVPFVK